MRPRPTAPKGAPLEARRRHAAKKKEAKTPLPALCRRAQSQELQAGGRSCGRAMRAHGSDRVRHDASTKSFLTHHVQQISKAAVMYDAMAIPEKLTGKKQELCTAAQAAAGGVQA